MKFKNEEDFYVVETVLDDGQYLCEYLINEATREVHIRGTSRNIHDKRIRKFENFETAEGVRIGLESSDYAKNPRVLKVHTETTIEEA